MSQYNLIATCAFGLEALVAVELKILEFTELKIENGRICFKGDEYSIVKCNLHLRCADRILIQMAEFRAYDFEQLFQGVKKIEWENFIPENGKIHVIGKTLKSKLMSVSDCQAITKKAIIESMKRKYSESWFKEDGPVYKIEVALLKDIATITIDTSGNGLHKRGYRKESGIAPLKETLAAALVYLSKWSPSRILADPFCGSGTIPIEALLIGQNIAPGLNRDFVSESWPNITKKIWSKMRAEAQSKILNNKITIYASDIDLKILRIAKENAANIGLEDQIIFQKKPFEEFSSKDKYGCIITNPPYGERLEDKASVKDIYSKIGTVFNRLEDWSFFLLTAEEHFDKYFKRAVSKKRKLYNGKIKCYLHQYFGKFPPGNN